MRMTWIKATSIMVVMTHSHPSHIMPSVGGFILGSSDFVSWVKDTFLSNRDDEDEIPQLRRLKSRVTLDARVQNICGTFGGSEKQIPVKGRKDKKARDIAIYFARDLSGVGCKEVGNFLGGISGAAITVRYNHVARKIKRHTKLNREAKKIKKHIRND
jgi:thermostable 8-oxoguanine DNA glycosylase